MEQPKHEGRKISRRGLLKLAALAGAVVVEELTCGIGKRVFDSLDPTQVPIEPEPIEPEYAPTACKPPSGETPLDTIINGNIENRESKRYQYTLHGIRFASDTITEAELAPDLDQAVKLIGGPYWQPGCIYVVEDGGIFAREIGGLGNGELSGSDDLRQFMISVKKTRVHELIHLLLGPVQRKWPVILAEFFAGAGSPKRKFLYNPEDTNHPSISMMQHQWAGAFNGAQTYFTEMREIVLSQLSQSMTDNQRIALVKAAIEKGEIDFAELPKFMKEFDIDHSILHPGQEGLRHYAYPGTTYDGRQWLLFVNFKATMENEYPKNTEVTVYFKDNVGNNLQTSPIAINFYGLKPINIEEMLSQTGNQGAAYIEIPEWDQLIQLQ